ncbi:MAG TPA: YraN family protein [Rhodospirillaceae bacterium]|nr:YraN family protein [Rhodospirillaceae bacterium]
MSKQAPHRTTRQKRGLLSYRRGHIAEFQCRIALWLKGYRIIAARYKTHQGEIDLIATRGNTLAFIEVKARRDQLAAAEAVTEAQKARLARTGNLFLARQRGFSRFTIRFDCMIVLPWRWPIHIENAFSPPTI